jgi:hypothetical protein
MHRDFLAVGDVVVGVLFVVNGIIFLSQKPPPGKARERRILGFGILFVGLGLLLGHWLIPHY